MASALSYIRRYPSTSLRFGRDDSAGCRRELSPARRHREISPFCPAPSSQALANLFAQAKIGNEAIVEFAPAGIRLTETPGGGAIFGEDDKTPPIKSYHRRSDTPRPTLKRQPRERPFGVTINRADQPYVITGNIKKQRSRHQVRFAHLKILILIKRLEPSAIRHRVLCIVVVE